MYSCSSHDMIIALISLYPWRVDLVFFSNSTENIEAGMWAINLQFLTLWFEQGNLPSLLNPLTPRLMQVSRPSTWIQKTPWLRPESPESNSVTFRICKKVEMVIWYFCIWFSHGHLENSFRSKYEVSLLYIILYIININANAKWDLAMLDTNTIVTVAVWSCQALQWIVGSMRQDSRF